MKSRPVITIRHWLAHSFLTFARFFKVDLIGIEPLIQAQSERTDKKVVHILNELVPTHSCIFVNSAYIWLVVVSNETKGLGITVELLLKDLFE